MIKRIFLAALLFCASVATAQPSSGGGTIANIPAKTLADFASTGGAALGANAYKVFSPTGSRGSYYDLNGYGNILVSVVDNSPGATSGVLYAMWSRDGANTAYNDPGDGSGLTNYYAVYNVLTDGNPTAGKLLPLGGRYVYFVYQNGATAQGATYPQVAEISVKAVATGFTSAVSVINPVLPVVGAADAATYGSQPVIIGGVDTVGAPTSAISLLMNGSGHAMVAQGSAANAGNTGWTVQGELAHDTADTTTNNPIILGARTKAHGSLPTAVADADVTRLYANREGLPFVIAGSPATTVIRAQYTSAQTDTALVTISTGTKIVVTSCHATVSNATTVNTAVRIGLGSTTTPTTSLVALSHPGVAPGGGLVVGDGSGIIVVGGDGDDLRITSGAPTTGALDVTCTYYQTAS